MGEMINVYKILVGKPEGKRPLGSPGHMWEYNIKMDFRKIGFVGVWIEVMWLKIVTSGGLLLKL
jgi:hypothetical protein